MYYLHSKPGVWVDLQNKEHTQKEMDLLQQAQDIEFCRRSGEQIRHDLDILDPKDLDSVLAER